MHRTLLLATLLCPAIVLHAETAKETAQPGTMPQGTVLRTTPTWSGFYGGINAGGGFGSETIYTTGQATANVNNVNGGARPAATYFDHRGAVGGVQGGYDLQLGHFVVGAEADLDGSSISGTQTVTTTALTGGAQLNNTFYSDLRYLGTARLKVGVAAKKLLFYGTGGFAYGETNDSAYFFGPSTANLIQFAGYQNKFALGSTGGGGIEYRMRRHLSVRAEYLRYQLEDNTVNVTVVGNGGGGTGYNALVQNKGNIVRGGFNYRF